MDFLSADNITKVVALIASIAVVFQNFKNISFNKKEKLRAEYEFIEKLLTDNKWLTMPDYLLEKGYLAISHIQLKATEIRFLLNIDDPLSKFQLYEKAKSFLVCVIDCNGDSSIKYKVAYPSEKRKWIKRGNIAGYIITASLGALPLVFLSNILQTHGVISLWGLFFWCIPFGFMAFGFVREYWNVSAAEKIMEENWGVES